MKALWIAVASLGLLTACSGGTGPVEVSQPGPGAGESPAPSPGEGAEQILAPSTGSSREHAIRKLEGECKIASDVMLAPSHDKAGRTNDSDMVSECAALCVLDSACDDIANRDQEHSVYRACIISCSQ